MAYANDIINIAVTNFRVADGDKETNLRRMVGFANAAAKRGADMVIFPEMALTGYGRYIDPDIPMEEKIAMAETTEGEAAKTLGKVAVDKGIYIVFGLPEKKSEDADVLYNSAFVLGPEGFVGSYQKIHPYGSENEWCKRGEEVPFIFDTEWGPVSLGICYDNYQFPELARWCAYKGSRLHLNPTAAAQEAPNENARYQFLRCYQPHLEYLVLSSSIYIASANLTGWDHGVYFGGGSFVCGPKTNEYSEVEVVTYVGDLDDYQNGIHIGTIDLTMADRYQFQDHPEWGGPDYRPEIFKKMFEEE